MAGLINNNSTVNDSLILSDSLGRNIRTIYKTDLLFYPGCTINALAHKVSTGEININNYNYIVLLIGTNDLAPKDTWKFYKSEKKQGRSGENLPQHITTPIPVISSAYLNLFDSIIQRNDNCNIFALGIPPRPYDNHRNKYHHIEVNKELSRICHLKNITFIKSDSSFLKFGKIIEELFIDGLHFTSDGSERISRLIECTINRQRRIKAKQNQ